MGFKTHFRYMIKISFQTAQNMVNPLAHNVRIRTLNFKMRWLAPRLIWKCPMDIIFQGFHLSIGV